MDLKRGPITYSRRLSCNKREKRNARRKPGAFVLIAAGLALMVHASAGLSILRPADASEPPMAQIIPAASAVVEAAEDLAHELAPLEDAMKALRDEAQTITASFELRPALAPAPEDLRPAIAIIIDDVGLSVPRTRRVIGLPLPITLSFLPYGNDVQSLADEARDAGHEIFLHLPMEPVGRQDPGPDALVSDLDRAELAVRTYMALNSFTGYTGINNHMGSRLTQDAGLMAEIMTYISARDVVFVDSLTSQQSLAYEVARAHGIATTRRDVFLDNDIDEAGIIGQLLQAEQIARRTGTAIAIAHPHEATLMVLQTWLESLEAEGIDVVPVSEIIRRRNNEELLVAQVSP